MLPGRLVLALTAGLLFGCGEAPDSAAPQGGAPAADASAATPTPAPAQPEAPPSPAYRVQERFEVGPSVYVRALLVEPERNTLWVGTSGGAHEVDLGTKALRNTFTREHGLANEYIFAIGLDHQGYKWFGTNAGGVSRYKDGDWKVYFPMHGLADYWVYSFASQRDGTLWIGTWAGANSVDPVSGDFTTYVTELVNEWVYGIDVDSKDRVWFGTEGGVSLYDKGTWRSWTHADGLGAANEDGLPASANTGLGTRSRHDLGILRGGAATYNPSYVFAIHVAQDDSVWAGTWGAGVSRFDGQQWQNFTRADGLANNIVYSITEEPAGVFWFGTAGGVSRYDGRSWQTFNTATGLIDNNVYALAVAPDGDIWVGTRGGVARIARQ